MSRPLAGRRVVVTRAEHQAGPLLTALREAGAEAVAYPLLRIAPPADPAPLDAALARLDTCARIAVTSRNAVDETARRAAALGIAGDRFPPCAALGPGTMRAARAVGWTVDLVPQRADAEGLLAALLAAPERGPILLPQAHNARPLLADGLRAAGHEVWAVEAYRGESAVPSTALDPAAVDVVTLASSATVERLRTALGAEGWRAFIELGVGFAAIGDRTAATLGRLGAQRVAIAPTPDDAGLVTAAIALAT